MPNYCHNCDVTYSPVEKYYIPTLGPRHRCRLCVAMYHDREGQCQMDNGFVPQTQNPHYYSDCPYNTGRWVVVSETENSRVSRLPEHKGCTAADCAHHEAGLEGR